MVVAYALRYPLLSITSSPILVRLRSGAARISITDSDQLGPFPKESVPISKLARTQSNPQDHLCLGSRSTMIHRRCSYQQVACRDVMQMETMLG
jgi:hypothetical protein